jgi:predicted kinase
MKKLYIIRGVPGSGKSTYARSVLGVEPFEADDFFMHDGKYLYQADKISQAHQYCRTKTLIAMKKQQKVIAVANTFVRKREFKGYIKLAEKYGYEVIIHVSRGQFQNVHNVPDEIVAKMKANFQE